MTATGGSATFREYEQGHRLISALTLASLLAVGTAGLVLAPAGRPAMAGTRSAAGKVTDCVCKSGVAVERASRPHR